MERCKGRHFEWSENSDENNVSKFDENNVSKSEFSSLLNSLSLTFQFRYGIRLWQFEVYIFWGGNESRECELKWYEIYRWKAWWKWEEKWRKLLVERGRRIFSHKKDRKFKGEEIVILIHKTGLHKLLCENSLLSPFPSSLSSSSSKEFSRQLRKCSQSKI